MKVSYAKCRKCGYNSLYGSPNKYVYSKEYDTYPIIKAGWCLDCKSFQDIQIGIDKNDLLSEIHKSEKELSELNGSFLRFGTKDKETHCKQRIAAYYDLLKSMLSKDSTTSTCINCGSANIVIKDIRHEIWACPQCHTGILELEELDDNHTYNIPSIHIKPLTFSYSSMDIYELTILCAMDMMRNENLHWLYTSNTPEKALNEDTITVYGIVERCAYVYAQQYLRLKESDYTKIVSILYEHFSLVLGKTTEDIYVQIFKDKVQKLAKIINKKDYGEIMYILYHPNGEDRGPSYECVSEYSSLYEIIKYTYSAYFFDIHKIFMETKNYR